MCGRDRPLSFHHLIPRRNHRRNGFQRRFSKEAMRTRGIWLCGDCHRMLHRRFDARELGLELNTLDAILAEPEVQRFLAWVRKQR